MNRFASVLGLAALTSVLSVAAAGCQVKASGETLINYTGNDANASAPYEDGQGIAISGVNGDITVKVGGSEVKATFSPFTMETDDPEGEEKAKSQLANDLVLEVTAGDPVQVRVSKKDGGSSYLGADVEVTIPSTFNGAFSVAQNNGQTDVNLGSVSPTSTKVISDNGSVTVAGATGAIDIQGDNGDVEVSISTWAESGSGVVRAGLGDITISIPDDADGSISLFAPDGVVNASFPTAWAKEESAANSVTYTMDDEEGGAHLDVTAESLSDINASTN